MEIKDIICTCTLEQRGQAFNAFVNDNVNKHLDSFKYKISHLSASEQRELLAKEIKTYEFVFSSDYVVSEPLKYNLFYLPNALQFRSVWRQFKKGYENRFGDEFKDFHLQVCPIIQPYINENGARITPEPIRHRFNLARFPYAYFFYLSLKEYYNTEYLTNRENDDKTTNSVPEIEFFTSIQQCVFIVLNQYYFTKRNAVKQKYQLIYQFLNSYYSFEDKSRYSNYIENLTKIKFELKTSIAGQTKINAFKEMEIVIKENNVI